MSMRKILFVGKIRHNIARGAPTTKIYLGKAPEKEKKEMNTSKRIQRPILLAIVAVLALALLVSTAVILAFADETPADSISISLDGKVNVNFKLATTKVEGYTASATIGNVAVDNVGVSTDDNGRTIFTVALMPYQMTETVKLTLTKEDAADIVKETTVVDYAKKIIGSDNEATAAWGDAARALLNYGAMTQIDKEYNTDVLANAGVFTKNNPIDGVTDITSEALVAKEGNLTGNIYLSFNEGDIALKYVIDYAGDNEIKAAVDGQSIALVNKNDGTYEFKITNISVNDFEKAWTVDITAGEDHIKSVRSVLQYLDYNAFDAASTATDTQKDVCKALYQLYLYTVAKPNQTECEHDSGEYWVSVENNDGNETSRTTSVKCTACAKEIDTSNTTVLDGGFLAAKNVDGSKTVNVTSDSVLELTRESKGAILQYLRNAADQATGDTTTEVLNVGNSEYIIVKYKISGTESTDRYRMVVSTTGASSTDPKAEKSNGHVTNSETGATAYGAYDGISAFWLDATNDAWAYKVLHGPTALMTFNNTDTTKTISQYADDPSIYKKDGTKTTDYIIDTLFIDSTSTTASSSLTIGYIAFADDLADVEKLLEGDTDAKSVRVVQKAGVTLPHGFNPSVNNYKDENVVNGRIQHNNGVYAKINGVETVVCANCKFPIIEKNFDADYLASQNAETQGNVNIDSTTLIKGESFNYLSIIGTGKGIEKFFSRGTLDSSAINTISGSNRLFNVGDSKFIIVKIKYNDGNDDTTNASKNATIGISTIEQNRYDRDGGAKDSNSTTDNGSGDYYSNLTIKLTEQWEVFVIDAEKLMSKAYKKTGDYYILDMLRLTGITLSQTESLDLAYIAFATDSAEVTEIVGNDMDVAYLQGSSSSTRTPLSDTCFNNNAHTDVTTTKTGNVYTTTCNTCGQIVATKDFNVEGVKCNALLVPDNWLATKQQDGKATSTQLAENGIWMARFTKASTASSIEYIWMRETYSYTKVDGVEDKTKPNSGLGNGGSLNVGNSKYIVMRVKSDAAGTVIAGRVSTTGYNLEHTNGAGISQSNISSWVTYGTCTNADTWYTLIVDMTDKKSAVGGNVWVMVDTNDDGTADSYVVDTFALNNGTQVDIAYIAFVETEDEALALKAADEAAQ